jgi:small membrane protein
MELVSRAQVYVVIPAYNEGTLLSRVVTEVKRAGYAVVVVDDGSADSTADHAHAAGAFVVRHPFNLGQGAALQTGIDYALTQAAQFVVTFDADGQHRVSDISRLIEALVLSALLAAILLYAWTEYRRSPAVAFLTVAIASSGLYFVWMPEQSTQLAELVGIGRGVDLILYVWVCISLVVLLNLHLKLRTQTELITTLARKIAITDAQSRTS